MLVGKRAAAAADYLRRLGVEMPRQGLLLEQWMTGFSGELSGLTALPQRRIPGFSEPRRGDFGGRLLLGRLDSVPTAVFEGMPHLSGGHLPGECGLAVRVLAALGVDVAVLVSAGSALGGGADRGSMFLVMDRLDLTGVAMLRGAADPPREPGIDPATLGAATLGLAAQAAGVAGVAVAGGVAALVHGPLLPTPAERRMLRTLGADAVSMGLAPELAAAALTGVRAAPLLVLDGPWGVRSLQFCRGFLAAFASESGSPGGSDSPTGLDEVGDAS